MASSWKLCLDVLFLLSIAGGFGFVIFVEQKEVFVYINMALVSVLCLLYTFYFISVRKADLMRWLEKNKPVEGTYVTRIKRKVAGLPYWAWTNLNIVIGIMYLPFPILMLITATTSENLAMIVTSAGLGILSIFFIASLMQYTSDMKSSFRVSLHCGTLSIFTGMFLISSNYGNFELFIGSALIIIGICCYYDMWKEFSMDAKLHIDTELEPVCNLDATDRTESPVPG